VASRSAVADNPEVDGETGRGAPRFSGAPDPDPQRPLGYYVHTGTLTLYPHGFLHKPPTVKQPTDPSSGLGIRLGDGPPIGAKRGRITDFSPAARRRLRTDLLTLHVPDYDIWDVTLTIQSDRIGDVTPDMWDKAKRRLFMRWTRAGFGGKWRVELQAKHQTPHLHCCVWTPPGMPEAKRNHLLYWAWIECLPEEKRHLAGVLDHAIHVKGPFLDVEQSTEWLSYMAGHASKHKKEQLGWIGKQWGTINASLFRERPPLLEMELSLSEEILLKRWVSRYLYAKTREFRNSKRAEGKKVKGRQRRLFFLRGCRAMRIMPPQVVKRIAEEIMLRRAVRAAQSLGPV
jgi:hypothetical protein